MKIVQPSFEIIEPLDSIEGVQLLRKIEHFARISHLSEDQQTPDSWQRFIKAVVCDKGDWSVAEHASASVVFKMSRGETHELVRHRHMSYTQESTRFVNYSKREMEFIEPIWKLEGTKIHPYYEWNHQCFLAEQAYLELLENGQTPQLARAVLPNSLAATIAVTGNLRAWRGVFLQRVTKETHPEMKRIMIPLLAEFKNRIPLLFDDIEVEQKQSISLSKPK